MSFVLFHDADLKWRGARPKLYQSSDEVYRGFCPNCGSVVSFERPIRGRAAVTAGSLDDPNLLAPSEHIFIESACSWLQLADGLPQFARFSDFLIPMNRT